MYNNSKNKSSAIQLLLRLYLIFFRKLKLDITNHN